MELKEFIDTNKCISVSGLEGSSKTRSIIKCLVESTNFNLNEIFIIAFKSYKLAKEKQLEIMETYGFSKDEVFLAVTTKESSEHYDKVKEYADEDYTPFTIPAQVKIIIMVQASLQRCLHNIAFNYQEIKRIRTILVDEFDPTIGIIPSLDYLLKNHFETEMFTNHVSDKTFLKFIRKEYSSSDYDRVRYCPKDRMLDFRTAYWIDDSRAKDIKIIFATSETLAVEILNCIGFTNFELPYKEFFDHTIHICRKQITSHAFKRLNNENSWSIFGFETIISDSFDPTLAIDTSVKVINHMSVRGTNTLAGLNLLTIVSNIPDAAIQKLLSILHFFGKKDYDFNKVKAMYYRDRICQAVGRVIGYRGEWKDNKETWLIVNTQILESLSIAENLIDLKIPYTLKEWVLDNPKLDDLIVKSLEDKRIKNESTNTIRNQDKAKRNEYINNKLTELFEKCEGNRIRFDDIKLLLSNQGICEVGGIRPGIVANFFSAKIGMTSKRIGKDVTCFRYIEGIKLKEQQI